MLDNEDQGRAVVTDHRAFVLFNVYLHACRSASQPCIHPVIKQRSVPLCPCSLSLTYLHLCSNLDEAVRAAQYRYTTGGICACSIQQRAFKSYDLIVV